MAASSVKERSTSFGDRLDAPAPTSNRCFLPSREVERWLLEKEGRELASSRALLLLLALLGPLVGHAFITAVTTYAGVSGIGGGPAALAQVLSPLDGFVVARLGALALPETLLCYFVASRLVWAV